MTDTMSVNLVFLPKHSVVKDNFTQMGEYPDLVNVQKGDKIILEGDDKAYECYDRVVVDGVGIYLIVDHCCNKETSDVVRLLSSIS